MLVKSIIIAQYKRVGSSNVSKPKRNPNLISKLIMKLKVVYSDIKFVREIRLSEFFPLHRRYVNACTIICIFELL